MLMLMGGLSTIEPRCRMCFQVDLSSLDISPLFRCLPCGESKTRRDVPAPFSLFRTSFRPVLASGPRKVGPIPPSTVSLNSSAPETQLLSLFWTPTTATQRRDEVYRCLPGPPPSYSTAQYSAFITVLGTLARTTKRLGLPGPGSGRSSSKYSAFTNVSNQCGEHPLLLSTAGRYNIDLSNDTMLRHEGGVIGPLAQYQKAR